MSWNVIKYKHYLLCLDPNQTEFVFFGNLYSVN